MRRRQFSLTGRHRMRVQKLFETSLDKSEEVRVSSTTSSKDAGSTQVPSNSLTTAEPADKLVKALTTQTPSRRTTVPAVKSKPAAKRTTTKKAAPKRAAKAAGTTSNGRLTHEDKLKLVPEIVKKLKSGVTFAQIRQEYVSSGLRAALAEKGYDTKGNKLSIEEISTAGGSKAFAKRVANARAEGMPWFKVVLATGKTEAELKQLLEDNGFGDLAAGRVVAEDDSPKPKRKPAAKKAAPKAKATTAKKATAKPRRVAAKASGPAPAQRAKPRPRRVSRPQ